VNGGPRGKDREKKVHLYGYLKNGWKKPIGADLGCPSFRDCPWPFSNDLDDHKFATAFIRGDKFIEADVSGEVDWISTFK
jgi:hypothetical protein